MYQEVSIDGYSKVLECHCDHCGRVINDVTQYKGKDYGIKCIKSVLKKDGILVDEYSKYYDPKRKESYETQKAKYDAYLKECQEIRTRLNLELEKSLTFLQSFYSVWFETSNFDQFRSEFFCSIADKIYVRMYNKKDASKEEIRKLLYSSFSFERINNLSDKQKACLRNFGVEI